MFYGGIDVAKHSHEVCLVNDSGDIVLRMHLDNNHKGMNKLLQALERLGLKPDDVKFCLEATAITGSLSTATSLTRDSNFMSSIPFSRMLCGISMCVKLKPTKRCSAPCRLAAIGKSPRDQTPFRNNPQIAVAFPTPL